jgi:hypothetical protein
MRRRALAYMYFGKAAVSLIILIYVIAQHIAGHDIVTHTWYHP